MTHRAAADDRPLLLLVGSGGQYWREYILRAVAPRFALWLLGPQPPTWELPYLAGSTQVDVLRVDDALQVVTELARHSPIRGVFSYDEVRVWQAARIAEQLGLPTSPPDAILACRDKKLSRERMARRGVPQPNSVPVADVAAAVAAADEIGYPVILKPRGLAGSEGVARAENRDELIRAFSFTIGANFTEVPRYAADAVLVEEYVTGPEISIDSIVVDGRVNPVALARKQLDLPPTFEETGHVVSATDRLLARPDVREVVEQAHAALGLTAGATHLELRLSRGGPKVIEMNARLGGDLIPYLVQLATGVDLPVAAASVAAGLPPDLTATRRCTAAVRFLYPEHDTVFARLVVDADKLPEGIWEVLPVARAGQTLRRPPAAFVHGRYAAAIALGTDPDQCQRSLDGVELAVQPSGRPLPEGQAQ